ncbi:MAG: hypothetical protein ACTHNU_15745 [Gaiellales bacterium]
MGRTLGRIAALGVAALVLMVPAGAGAATSQQHVSARGGLDCNGFSPLQKTYKHLLCTEVSARGGGDSAFEDNGHYIGHDEPSILFYSGKNGSGNDVTWNTTLPREPKAKPNGEYDGPIWDYMLRPTDWFGMVMCDTQSYPEGTHVCKRDSNSNLQAVPTAHHAGAAYMELQLYPPGWNTSISCQNAGTKWCAALTIDSFQGDFAGNVNANCEEPVNFAFLTHNGVPVGPPGPDQQTAATFTVTPNVLLMNGGDRLHVRIHDSQAGLVTTITDLTSGQTGSMTASVANGFRHIVWDPTNFTCNGAPYAFHPMFSTAARPTASGQPRAWAEWTAHTYNVSYTSEIGHFQKPDSDSDDPGSCQPGPVIPGCTGTDLDFDGYGYHRGTWPNGTSRVPTPWYVQSPTSDGVGYSMTKFETDIPRITATDLGGTCNRLTGAGCKVPPDGAQFYPFVHTARTSGGCMWAVSDNLPNQISNFGGMRKAWGKLLFTNYGAGDIKTDNFSTKVMNNPC